MEIFTSFGVPSRFAVYSLYYTVQQLPKSRYSISNKPEFTVPCCKPVDCSEFFEFETKSNFRHGLKNVLTRTSEKKETIQKIKIV